MLDFQTLFEGLSHEERIEFARKVFPLIGKYCCDNRQYYGDIWHIAEESGFNLVAQDYYSPIVFERDIPKHSVSNPDLLVEPAFLGLDKAEQKSLLSRLAEYQKELFDIPFQRSNANEFCWANGMFPIADSYLYYSMIRHHRPRRIIEVGSGQSTLMALAALNRNGQGALRCIEPAPDQHFNRHLKNIADSNYALTVTTLQEAPLECFKDLQENDFLFIDSSHVLKAGSDLSHLFFRIIPSLSKGVLLHFHDIFLPYDYPPSFMRIHKRFFNEQYFLAALLMNNRNYRPLFGNFYFLWQNPGFFLDVLAPLIRKIEDSALAFGDEFDCRQLFVSSEMPLRPHLMGGSFWLQV